MIVWDWLLAGLVGTTLLTAVLVGFQLMGRTRLDLPLLLGTFVCPDPDRARAVGFFIHLGVGLAFALVHFAGFEAVGHAGPLLGMVYGLVHAAVALTVLVPLLPGLHPRLASERAGPATTAMLEPPGLLALNYGWSTPLVAFAAHALYGAVLGLVFDAA